MIRTRNWLNAQFRRWCPNTFFWAISAWAEYLINEIKSNEFFPEKEDPIWKNKTGLINQSNGFITVFMAITNNITQNDGSCYKLIDSLIRQEIFSSYWKY